MWVSFGKLHKLWLIYLFLTFFGTFIVFYGTKLLFDKSAFLKEHRNRLRLQHERRLRAKNNVNLIVGHYIGTGNIFGNLSKDYYNTNNFSPIAGEGENGKPVVIPAKDILRMQQYFQINRFNLVASDRIPLNRTIPDVRKTSCISKSYPTSLPTTSVIIVFHNEAWSVLLRTIWSVINRSPKKYLKEILLVDDASERDFLKTSLEHYVKTLPVITKIFRLSERSGLVAARLLGAEHATGESLTFLDAHCECSPGWLEPLLARIKENRKKVVCPVIDIISDDNFSYIKSFEFHSGAFNWMLHFRWYTLSSTELESRKIDVAEPFKTPAMAGGLFTIDRDYFYEIGSYDSKMKIWGGDNLEMSFRIWQCGGEVEIAPCSHVGHLFRKSSPYTFPGGVNEILNANLARLALVWMDDWTNFFFKINKIEKSSFKESDISDRVRLRSDLVCNSFEWYLKNIWQHHFFPTKERLFGKFMITSDKSKLNKMYSKLIEEFEQKFKSNDSWRNLILFFNSKTSLFSEFVTENDLFCLTKPTSGANNNPFNIVPKLKKCKKELMYSDEMFVTTNNGKIMTNEGVCLDSPEYIYDVGNMTKARIFTCTETNDRQKWKYSVKTRQIKHISYDYCLEGSQSLRHIFSKRVNQDQNDSYDIFIKPCSKNVLQKWIIFPVNWK